MLPRFKSQLCHLEVVTFRDICLKPESLHLHPTHLPKSQLVLEEVDDAFMSRSEGTRRDNEVSMHHRSLLPQRFFFKDFYLFIFRERGSGGEREGEKH